MKNITHLLFQCPVARCVWGIVAQCLGAHDIPSNLAQYWRWIKRCLPGGEGVYAFGLAAICWAIWKARNKACFGPCKMMAKQGGTPTLLLPAPEDPGQGDDTDQEV
ncbi:hypothetical protein SETIT_8G018600v2 [Setaria italica]|uniref:Reverse transcriptase zinc-binding domain-containing protein n=1 Tax=Setaria italica TaxID=4555 RepID=A0A368S4Z3_SETIT|nr:hypothetical protein SETIT_8G018600v2 [Setaria italica]